MKTNEYKNIYLNEKNHWWYSGMRSSFLGIINEYLKNKNNLTILDAGCGTGYNIKIMQKFGNVYGIDYSSEAIKFCRLNKLKNIKKASVEDIPFKDNTFNLVASFEVLYHEGVNDDKKALREIVRVCKENGIIAIRLPAFEILKRKHDIQVHGVRRYDKKTLIKMTKGLNIKIEKITYLNSLFFFPVLLLALIQKNKKSEIKSDIKKTNKFMNRLLKTYLTTEGCFARKINIPFGTSILMIARKTKS